MKRIFSSILILIMLVQMCGCADKKQTNMEEGTFITRASWVSEVARLFGMTEALNSTPYFEDVDSSSEIFNYVQSCYEWGAISTDTKKFNPGDVATLGFAVCSSVMILTGWEEGHTNEEILTYAVKLGLLSEDEKANKLNTGLTAERASTLVLTTKALYLAQNMEVVNDVVINEKVEDYGDMTEEITYVADNEYKVASNLADSINVNDILTIPATDGINEEVAVKVVEINENEDGSLSVITSQPELEEVFDYINVSGTREVYHTDFVPEEGVTVVPLYETAEGVSFKTVANDKKSTSFETHISFDSKGKIKQKASIESSYGDETLKYGINEKGEIQVSGANEGDNGKIKLETYVPKSDAEALKKIKEAFGIKDMTVNGKSTSIIEDYESGIITKDKLVSELKKNASKVALESYKPYEEGWKITGKIAFKDIMVTPDIKFGDIFGITNIFDIKKASIQVTGDLTISVEVEGKIESEVKVGTFPIAVPGTPIAFNLDVYLYSDVNGKLAIKYGLAVDSKFEMKEGAGIKFTDDTTLTSNSVEANIKMETGCSVSGAVYILGFDMISIKLKAGVGVDASAEIEVEPEVIVTEGTITYKEKTTLTSNIEVYIPVLTIELNKTKGNILGKTGLSGEFIISDKDRIKEGKFPGIYTGLNGTDDLTIELFTITKTFDIVTEEEETQGSTHLLFEKLAVNMNPGENVILALESIPMGYVKDDLTWSSSDTAVASVNSSGEVMAVADGSAIITVATKDGEYSTTCIIQVIEE